MIMTQAKEDFVLVFPKGMCGEKTINVHVSPFTLKDVVKQIMTTQDAVFGDLCIVQAGIEYNGFNENTLMVACSTYTKGEIIFFTAEDDVQLINQTIYE